MRYLCILDIDLMLVPLFANVFSHSVGCLSCFFFFSLKVSFAVQELLSVIRSHMFIFAFISNAFGRLIYENTAVIYVSYVLLVASQVAKQ